MDDDWRVMLSGFHDVIGDFAATNPKRLPCADRIMPFDIDWALQEVDRIIGKGARCIQLPTYPNEYGLKHFHDESYRPPFAKIEDAGLVILQQLDAREVSYDQLERGPTPMRGIARGTPALSDAFADATVIGKRYTDGADTLLVKQAKALPSSD